MANIFAGTNSYKSSMQKYKEQGQATPIREEAGFADRVSSAFDYSFRIGTSFGRGSLENPDLQEQRRLHLEKKTGLFPEVRLYTLGGKNKSEEDILRDSEEQINKLKQQYPDAGFRTLSEIQEQTAIKQKMIMDKNNSLAEASSGLGKVGAFLGYVGGHLADPVNLGTLAIGAPIKAGAIGQSFLRVGASEAAIEAALQVKDKPGELAVRERLGEEISAGQVAGEVATAIGTAGILGGSIGAIASKLLPVGDIKNPVSQRTADLAARARKGIADGEIRPTTELTDHLNLVEEASEIAERTPENLSQLQHGKAYEKAREDLRNGDDVDVSEAIPEVRSAQGEASEGIVPAPEGTAARAPTEDEIFDKAINDAAVILEREDVEFKSVDTDGNVLESGSARQIIRDLDREQKGLNNTSQCLLGGANGA